MFKDRLVKIPVTYPAGPRGSATKCGGSCSRRGCHARELCARTTNTEHQHHGSIANTTLRPTYSRTRRNQNTHQIESTNIKTLRDHKNPVKMLLDEDPAAVRPGASHHNTQHHILTQTSSSPNAHRTSRSPMTRTHSCEFPTPSLPSRPSVHNTYRLYQRNSNNLAAPTKPSAQTTPTHWHNTTPSITPPRSSASIPRNSKSRNKPRTLKLRGSAYSKNSRDSGM
jgi:hypothetical protein